MSRIDLRHLLLPAASLAVLIAASQLLLAPMAHAAPVTAMQPPPQADSSESPRPEPAPQFQLTPEERGDVLLAEKRFQAAIEAYKEGPGDSARIWDKLGVAYQQMFDPDDAKNCYLASLRLNPRNSGVLNNLGTVYASFKNYRAAERFYRKALRLNPNSAVILKNLGTNFLMRRKYKQGGKMYAAAIAIDPQIFESTTHLTVTDPTSAQDRGAMNYYMAVTCARAGEKDRAVDFLRKALDEGYTNPRKIVAESEFAGLRGVPAFEHLLADR